MGMDSTRYQEDPMVFILNNEQNEIFRIVVFVFICTLLCLFGITVNIINIIIFVKQGFSQTVNISFCGLAISDLMSLIIQLWINICFNPLFKQADLPFVPVEVSYLTGSKPSVCFTHINSWITAFITAERCLSIVLPLKVKQIMTPKRAATVVISIYVMNFVSISTEYYSYNLDWVFYPTRNETLFGIVKNANHFEYITYLLHILMGYVSFIAVIVFTAILVSKLTQTAAWRKTVTGETDKSESMSNRDRRTVKMVVFIATIMVVSYTPFTFVALAIIIDPEFSLLGTYRSTFTSMLAVGFLFTNTNASVNIFLYYRMSTKYRLTFHELFSRCLKQPEEATAKTHSQLSRTTSTSQGNA